MANESNEGVSQAEQEFRDAYGSDPAGAVFREVINLHQRLENLSQRVGELRRILEQVDPERMDSLERTELLRDISRKLDEVSE